MKNPFSRFFRARDKPGATDSVSSAPTFYFGSSAAGKSVTASTAIQMSTVYACVRVIAETIASLPLHVYQNQGEGSVKALDHPLYPILHDEPNSEMTSFVWRETMLAHLLLWGNAYCQIIRSGRRTCCTFRGWALTGLWVTVLLRWRKTPSVWGWRPKSTEASFSPMVRAPAVS